jgi:integrase
MEISPTKVELKTELDKRIKPDSPIVEVKDGDVKSMNLVQFTEYLVNNLALRKTTLTSYEVVKRNLIGFEKKNKKVLTFKNVDIDFYNSFVKFLTNLGLSQNTIGTRIKILKTIIRNADERNIDVSKDYLKKSFSKPHEETEKVYLNETELNAIYKLNDLPKYLDSVRDTFLIGCYTGLRYSDLSRLTKDNITTDNTIQIKVEKSKVGQIIDIPIHPHVRQIFEKYDYNLPAKISNQKYNDYIKLVVKHAEIEEHITREQRIKGMMVTITTPKHDLITSHTARRSFATNAFLADVPVLAIMKITGHKTETAFMKYIKMSSKDNAMKLQSHKFFNPLTIAR